MARKHSPACGRAQAGAQLPCPVWGPAAWDPLSRRRCCITSQIASPSRTQVAADKEEFGGGGDKGHGPPRPMGRGVSRGKECARSGKEGAAGKEQQSCCGAADKPAQNNKRLHYTSVLVGESGRRPAQPSACARPGQRSGCWHKERDPLALKHGGKWAAQRGTRKKKKKSAGHVTRDTFSQAMSGLAATPPAQPVAPAARHTPACGCRLSSSCWATGQEHEPSLLSSAHSDQTLADRLEHHPSRRPEMEQAPTKLRRFWFFNLGRRWKSVPQLSSPLHLAPAWTSPTIQGRKHRGRATPVIRLPFPEPQTPPSQQSSSARQDQAH